MQGPGDREQMHHLVEARVVASSIVIAALGMPDSVYDWSWMQPFGPWMERLPYRSLPLAPSLLALRALNAGVAAVVGGAEEGLSRSVRLRDAPDAELRRVTVAGREWSSTRRRWHSPPIRPIFYRNR